MRVVLEVTTGPDAGRKVYLGARQVLEVGRTEWADLAIAQDAQMADVHFSLETDHSGCHIKDLSGGQGGGTQVNGQQLVERAALRDGDKILAGNTAFAVHIEGTAAEAPPAAAEELVRTGLSPVPKPIAAADSQAEDKVTYTVETCDTGLTLYRGHVEDIQPHDLAITLSQAMTPYLIVDFKKLESGKPESIDPPDYLFDWLDPAAAAAFSPLVVSRDELATWPALIEEGWGEDAVICLFSEQEKLPLLTHLRALSRGRPDPQGRGSAIVGYCWPSVMAPLLAHYTPEFVKKLLSGIDGVLVELPDLPITWQIYGNGRLGETLDRLGFVRAPDDEEGGKEEEASPEPEEDA